MIKLRPRHLVEFHPQEIYRVFSNILTKSLHWFESALLKQIASNIKIPLIHLLKTNYNSSLVHNIN